jgi:hypothetical protein
MAKAFDVVCAMISIAAVAPAAMAQSHLNVPASQHVILASEGDDGTCCSVGQCFRFVHFPLRLLPNGQTEPFSIPSDKVLVITDVEWDWVNSNNPFLNQTQLLRLFLGPGTAVDVAISSAVTDGNSFAGASIGLTSGFTVAPGTPVCGFFGFGGPGFLAHVTLGGYLDSPNRKKPD